jgi:2-aminoadipate transaminase
VKNDGGHALSFLVVSTFVNLHEQKVENSFQFCNLQSFNFMVMSAMQIAQLDVPEDVIDLGIGQPGPDVLPLELLQQATNHALQNADRDILQYGADAGDDYFRASLANFLTPHYSETVKPESLLTTNGISQALGMICTLFTKPGDTIVVEEPTYFLALNIFADYDLNIISVPVDEHGLQVDKLRSLLKKHEPKFIYTIPTFQNPSGVTLSLERRQRLLELAENYDVLIVADEVYHLLSYAETLPKPLGCFESNVVMSLGSFSKILAPGLRLGWIQTSSALLEKLSNYGVIASGGGLNPFTSAVVRSVLDLGLQENYLTHLKRLYRDRSVLLTQTIRERLPELEVADVQGGYFVWLHLPKVDTAQLLEKTKVHKMGFQPGAKFTSSDRLTDYLRLCFAFYDEAHLQEGVKRLAEVLKE